MRRLDLEHTFRLFKQVLGWTAPKIRDRQARTVRAAQSAPKATVAQTRPRLLRRVHAALTSH